MILPAVGAGEREAIAGGVKRLAELGWNEGGNLRLDQVWLTNMDLAVARTRASELIARAPDLIWLLSNPVMAVMQRATRTIPIVFVQVADPVGSKFVESLARPGGNVTGFTNFEDSMGESGSTYSRSWRPKRRGYW